MTQDHARVSVETSQSTHNAQVIAEVTIAMHLYKIGEELPDVIQGIGALWVTSNFGDLPSA